MLTKLHDMREERKEGFTLIELLVVILIIGILSAIAIPFFLNQRKSVVDTSVKSDIKNAATQVKTMLVKMPNTTTLDVDTVNGVTTLKIKIWGAGTVAVGTATSTTIKVSEGTVLKGANQSTAYADSPYSLNGYPITDWDKPGWR